MKIASVRGGWRPSVSTDVKEQIVSVVIDGVESLNVTVAPEISEVLFDVKASSSVVFSVTTVDVEGNMTLSESYTFNIGNLEAPQPATDLFHEILAVRDGDDEPIV